MSSLFAGVISNVKTIPYYIGDHIPLMNLLFVHFLIDRLGAKKFTLWLRMSIREINGQVILHVIPHVVTSLTLEMRAALNRVSESGMVIKGLPDHLDRILIGLFLSA